jgi:hypothetical protein
MVVKFPYGKPVTLLIDMQGYPDGRLIQFEIWRLRGQSEEKIAEVYGVTRGQKGIGEWNPPFNERKETLSLEKQISQSEEEKYYFVAKIDDQEIKSENMIFTYPLTIYLVNDLGQPVDGAKFTVTFSDGTKTKGVFAKGYAKVEEAPSGKYKLELEEYEFEESSLGNSKYITGKVVDPSGKPIKDAKIAIISNERKYELQTDGAGIYRIDDLLPGRYSLTVEAKGYPTIRKNVEV